MKSSTTARFHEWAKTASPDAVFVSGTHSWTREQFETEVLGLKPKKISKPLNIDVKVEKNADLESTQHPGHSEKFGG
jgi:hypothetical protein